MKIYITSRFSNAQEERENIERLCTAVRKAGHEDFSFIRDVENFDPNYFSSQKDVWSASLKYLKQCDALLVDVTDAPSGGRVVEAGMAYALGLPVYVMVKKGAEFKSFYKGIAARIIEYGTFSDVADILKQL